MLQHHKDSIEKLLQYFQDEEQIIAIILGGSVAKGLARPDSDIDAIVVVEDEKHKKLERENRLSECIWGKCTYEGGYFDIKYVTMDYLRKLAVDGSEPSRNAFLGSRCIYGELSEVPELIAAIPVFQVAQKQEKMLSFLSAFDLNYGYFWQSSAENRYLRLRAASDIVYYGLRLILQEKEILFPCHKSLVDTVSRIDGLPNEIMEATEDLLTNLTDEAKQRFVDAIFNYIKFVPPKEHSNLSRFVEDHELWWYKNRPYMTEW